MPGFIDELLSHPLLDETQQAEARTRFRPDEPADQVARAVVELGWLTAYQAAAVLRGRGRDLVVGSYTIRRPLGAGGMGQVYEAWHSLLGKAYALKVIHPDRLNDPDAITRFEREIRAVARLTHPNIVAVHHADRYEEAYYLAMELVAGSTLEKIIAERGRLPIPDACDAARQAADGLQHIHEQNLVHRDIKPSNLIRSLSGTTKILDLGLALLASNTTLTANGRALIGTVDYIAPEQITAPHGSDIRADIYSLGCTLYHALTGQVLFPDAHPCARPYLHQTQAPTPVAELRPDVPPRLVEVLGRMLAKNRDERFATPGEVAAALAPFVRRSAAVRIGECVGGWWLEEEVPGAGRAGYFRGVRDGESGLVQVVPARTFRDDAEAERFHRAWTVIGATPVAGLPTVKQVGKDRDYRFVVLEQPPGIWLDEFLAESGGLAPEKACELVSGLSAGLDEVHRQGVVHGNLHPASVVYRTGGRSVLVGFGLPPVVRMAAGGMGSRSSFRTLAFAAPEQVRKGRADAQGDVYGLAGLLYHAINAALGEKSEPDYFDPTLVPENLRELLARCLSADPARRAASAADFAVQLQKSSGPPRVRIEVPGRWFVRSAGKADEEWSRITAADGFTTEPGREYAFKARPDCDNAALAAFAKVPPELPVLRIDLRGTRVTDDGLAHLEHLSAVEALDLGCTGVTGAGLTRLRGCTRLRSLDLARSGLAANGCRGLSEFPALAEVTVEGCKGVTDETLTDLARLPALIGLVASDTAATDVGLGALAAVTGLRRLAVERCTGVTDAALARLRGLSGLGELRLTGTGVTDAGLAHLRPLVRLTALELGGTAVGDAGVAHLRQLTGLTHLDLSNTRLTAAGATELARMGNLRMLTLWRCEGLDADTVAKLKKGMPLCRVVAG